MTHGFLVGGEPIVVADIHAFAGVGSAERSRYAEMNIRALLGVPLNKKGRLVGNLAAFSSSRTALTQDALPPEWSPYIRVAAVSARKWLGDLPVHFLNAFRKLDGSEKPTRSQTSSTESAVRSRYSLASVRRTSSMIDW